MKDNKKICIAVDVMGGDFGPSVLIPAALWAAKEENLALKLVGQDWVIREILEKYPLDGLDVEVVHADEVAEMGDKPSHILRKKKNTSIQVACDLVKEGAADAVVSAGHTGVTLACGMFTFGRLKGIERPALATILPREKKPFILIDVGANVDAKPRHLVQFAIMGDSFARKILKVEEPQIGLLNIGEEPGKGNAQVSAAYSLLKNTSLNFIGNVEGRDLFGKDVDIAVCDGFVGNIALKLSEGVGLSFLKMLKKELKRGLLSRFVSFLGAPVFKRFYKKLNYEEYGGAPLLGLKKPVFVCHGSARELAIFKTIKTAAEFVRTKLNEEIKALLEKHPEITRFYKIKHIFHTSKEFAYSHFDISKEKKEKEGKDESEG